MSRPTSPAERAQAELDAARRQVEQLTAERDRYAAALSTFDRQLGRALERLQRAGTNPDLPQQPIPTE